jgi:spermidine synthase
MTAILCVIFFFSGASALIFEFLWFQTAGLTFGNSIWATSLVLAGFMGGLAMGSALVAFKGHKIKSPIRFYALIEIIIGVSGFLLVIILPNLTKILVPVYRSMLAQPVILNLFKAAAAFGLMFLPACAMGATLPLLVKALYRENPSFGRVLGILYGWNTFGAAAGVIAGELFLVVWFGIRGAGLTAAGFNFLAAAAAFGIYKKKLIKTAVPDTAEPVTESPAETVTPIASLPFSFAQFRLLAAGFLSGLTLLGLEVIWFRFMLLSFSATSLNFSLMLVFVLLGIALGGMFASRWFKKQPEAHRFLIPILLLNGILIIFLYTNFGTARHIVEQYGDVVEIATLSLFLIFPISFLSGTIFTHMGKALHNEMKSETRAVGLLTLANTVGGMIGSLAAGFILLPYIGVETSFFLFAVFYGLIAILVFQGKKSFHTGRNIVISSLFTVVYLIVLVVFPFGLMESHYLKVPLERYSRNGEHRVAVREGITETLQYLQMDLLGKPYYHRLITNSHTMSGTWMNARRYMKLFVYWPVAIHPQLKKALLICYGCGMTAKALTDTKSLEKIDIVDISKDVIEESVVVFPDPHENPIKDPRVNVYIEDGRFFLLTRKRQYDLITAEPPPPKARGIVNLYTKEYFQLIYNRLADGGIVTYWLPVYQMDIHESKAILKAFSEVFRENSLWSGAGLEWMMVGIKNPGPKTNETRFAAQWNDPTVSSEMHTLGFQSPEQFGAFFIADGDRLRKWMSSTAPLTDNYPKRLSSDEPPHPLEKNVVAYIAFMESGESRTNFMTSAGISRLWPDSLREKTGPHFDDSLVINEILIPINVWRRYKDVYYLHQCLHRSSLSDYIHWIVGSDRKAQTILSAALLEKPLKAIESPATFIHLASGALRKKNYLLAEYYLNRLKRALISQHSLDNYLNFYYCTIRMYLLFSGGNKEGAKRVEQEFLNDLEKREGNDTCSRMEIQLQKYMEWLEQTLRPPKNSKTEIQ